MRYSHDGVDAAAVALPHGTEPRLAADVPQLDGHVALGDLAHVEAHRGNHVLVELARLGRQERPGNSHRRSGTYTISLNQHSFCP